MKKNILFITWDGPETSYMEGLFMPIFNAIQERDNRFQFHCLQFTWGTEVSSQENASKKYNIPYKNVKINKKPIATLASFYSLLTGHNHIQKYVKDNNIDILMPRSNFPAYMTRKCNLYLPILFDADGLPIEERIDFGGLKRSSLLFKFLKKIEQDIVVNANRIITRSQKAIDYLETSYLPNNYNKFSIVLNGRDSNNFNIANTKDSVYKELNIDKNSLLLIYVGSLGEKYAIKEMLEVFYKLRNENKKKKTYFLILTGNKEYALSKIEDFNNIIVKKAPFEKVNYYLNAADIAIGLIYPKLSMQGASAVKYGEYLLSGLPTIASKGIGDSENILQQIPNTFLFDHNNVKSVERTVDFIKNNISIDREGVREKALMFFSIEASADSYIKALNQLI